MPIRRILKAILLLLTALTCTQSRAQTATTTVLTLLANGNPVSTVSTGTAITLTATVTAGGSAIQQGQVNFCNATAAHCTDVNILGTEAITSVGSATLAVRPGPGTYSYKAEFIGTPSAATPYAASASASAALTVTGSSYQSTALIAQSGTPGDYTLTASIYGFNKGKSAPAPTGTVSFIDTTTSNSALTTATLSASAAGSYLINTADIPVGGETNTVVSGDFNNDGNPDFAIGVPPSVAVFLGDGTGGFQAVTNSSITASGNPVLVADFNGDGKPDMLLSNAPLGSTLTVMLGNGDGTFTPAPDSPTTFGEAPIVTADFNGDGIPDLAAAGGNVPVVFLGKGDGTFTQGSTIAVSLAGLFGGMVTGDFNNDGKQDIAIASNAIGGQTITLYLGNGDGTFTQGSTIAVSNQSGGSSINIAVGDFNGDGNLDLATPIYGPTGSLAIYLGNGDGTFTAASGSPIPTIGWANTVQVGDFNGDGIPDLYVTGPTNPQNLAIHLGDGDGTFRLVPSANTPQLPCCSYTTLADFNKDGVTDILASDFYHSQADVYLTALTQSAASSSGISITGVSPQQILASYPGDSTYSSSQSTTTPLEVQATAPTFSPTSGTIGQGQSITITTTTPNTTIYFELSSYPNAWFPYTEPLPLPSTGTITIQAYATAPYYGQSTTTTTTYTVVVPNPAPTISTLSPAYARSGAAALTLTLTGSGFVSSSTAYWGTTALTTQFTSATQLTAQLPASALATAGIATITVQTPTPGGGTSNAFQFEIDSASAAAAPSFSSPTASVSPGATANYAVTLPSAATNVSVNCLNLPTGATCSYSAASGAVSIATTSATPTGSYQVTTVFSETLPTAFSAMLWAPLLLLPAGIFRLRKKQVWLFIFFILTLSTLSISGCSKSTGGGTSTPPTEQLTSSSIVTLQVQ